MSLRYVLGMGGTVDYEIRWDSAVLEQLAAEHRIVGDDLDIDAPVNSERDLVRNLLAFVRDGAGGERFVATSDIVAAMATRWAKDVTLGGTCVRAALAMNSVGLPSTVHLVSIDETVRRLLPDTVDYVSSATTDTLDPHLIVQYPEGAQIRIGDQVICAPRPNRIIYANDPPHRELLIAPELPQALHRADVFLLSSFNVIQNPAVLHHRLTEVQSAMVTLPALALVMFEDAGFHIPAHATIVRDTLAPVVDIYSLNEDEAHTHLGRDIDLRDPRDIAQAVTELRTLIPAPTLVLHTQHWALAVGHRGARLGPALRGGIIMASTRYRLGDDITAADAAHTAQLPPGGIGRRVSNDVAALLGPTATVVPALDLSTVTTPTTIGLGDAFVGGFLAALDPQQHPGRWS